MDEVRADDLVFGVLQDTLEVRLACLFHRRADFVIARFLNSANGEIHDRDCRCRHAKGHAGELAFDFGQYQTDGFGRPRGRWD